VSKKNGKTAQVAEAKKQKKPELPVDPLTEPIVISENIRKQAAGLGIDVGRIVDVANLLRERVLGLETGIMTIAHGLDERDKKLQPLVELAKAVEARKQQSIAANPAGPAGSPQQGGGLVEQIVMKGLNMATGPETNPMMQAFMQAVFNAGIENMFMGSAMVKTMVAKVAPEMYAEAMTKAQDTSKKVTQAGT